MPKGQPNVKYNSKGEVVKSPISIDDGKKFYPGTICTSSEGDRYVIEDYIDSKHVTIRFLDQYQYTYTTYRSSVVAGTVRNVYHPLVHGGYIGEGPYGRKADEHVYHVWSSMHQRIQYANEGYTDYAHYKNVSICPEWACFQNFAIWMYNELAGLNPKYKYAIDKDILQWNQQFKIYSPDTCSLIPESLNKGLSTYKNIVSKYGLPSGVSFKNNKYYVNIDTRQTIVNLEYDHSAFLTPEEAFKEYKRAKEQYIRDLADYYYNDGAIYEKIKIGLYNIEVKPFSDQQLLQMQQEANKDLEIERLRQELELLKQQKGDE